MRKSRARVDEKAPEDSFLTRNTYTEADCLPMRTPLDPEKDQETSDL